MTQPFEADGDGDRGLAAERTALAWNRTGMAFIVAGAVLLRMFPPQDDPAPGLIGVAMALIGTAAAAFGWRSRDRRAAERAVRRLAVATVVLAVATAASALLG
jgi:uncharacterized membrane protein YidH (DUF202 family)